MPPVPGDQVSPYLVKNRSVKGQSQSGAETVSHPQRHSDRGSGDDEADGDKPAKAKRPAPIMPPDGPGSFTVEEFLTQYKICRAKFYQEVRAGRLKLMKVGTRSFVSFRSAHEWEKACGGA
jgi:hypothetical protein